MIQVGLKEPWFGHPGVPTTIKVAQVASQGNVLIRFSKNVKLGAQMCQNIQQENANMHVNVCSKALGTGYPRDVRFLVHT